MASWTVERSALGNSRQRCKGRSVEQRLPDLTKVSPGRRHRRPHRLSPNYTELEYDIAGSLGKTRLPFLAPEEFPVPAHLIESDRSEEHTSELQSPCNLVC